MLQNLQTFAEFQKFQLDNLVDFEKCCKTRILKLFSCKNRCRYSRKRATFCRKFSNNWQLPYGFVHGAMVAPRRGRLARFEPPQRSNGLRRRFSSTSKNLLPLLTSSWAANFSTSSQPWPSTEF